MLDWGRCRLDGEYDTLIFLHIPKTAGTTLRKILERQYRHSGILEVYDKRVLDHLELEGTEILRQVPLRETGLLAGHIVFGWHRFLPGRAVYLTMLRDPVDRVVSLYYYVREDPRMPLHFAVRDGSVGLEDYLKRGLDPEASNGQTYWLSGGLSGEEALRWAKRNLDFFPVVGIQERFDESLVLFRRVFGWRSVFYSKRNVVLARPRTEDLPDRVRRLISERNQLDLELYDYARRRFESSANGEGDGFREEVARFKALNRTYGKLVSMATASSPREMVRDFNSEVRSFVRSRCDWRGAA
jgi:hypothetical protein